MLDTLASRPEARLAAITRGAGDYGVTAWRVKNAPVWNRVLRLKEAAGLVYPSLLTDVAETVYKRLTKGAEMFSADMPLEFEAWAIIVLKVTFETPHCSHTERNCGRPIAEVAINVVKRQREIIAAAQASQSSNEDQ